MKRNILMTLLFILCSLPIMAQGKEGGHPRFNPEDFRAKMDAYVAQKAGLTTQEADKFFPIYHEMKTKQMEINHKIHKLKKPEQGNSSSDKDYSKTISEITSLNIELAKLESTYYSKLCKVVPAKKVYAAMIAEDAFHREMLQKADSGRRNGDRGRKPDGKEPAPKPRKNN